MGEIRVDTILPQWNRQCPTVVAHLKILCIRITGEVCAGHVALGTCEIEPEVALPREFLAALLVDSSKCLRLNTCPTVVSNGLEIVYSIHAFDRSSIDESLGTVEIHLGESEDYSVVDIRCTKALARILTSPNYTALFLKKSTTHIAVLIRLIEVGRRSGITIAGRAGHRHDAIVVSVIRIVFITIYFEDDFSTFRCILTEAGGVPEVFKFPHGVFAAVDDPGSIVCSLLPLAHVEIYPAEEGLDGVD